MPDPPSTKQRDSREEISDEITPAEAWKLIYANLKDPACVVIDVREPAEYRGGLIGDARNLDYQCRTFADDLVA